MIQSMLADRFQLEFHRETRTLQEYALVASKGGPKLQEAAEEDKAHGGTSQGPRQIKARSATLSDLARMLIGAVGAPVLDRTGIAGSTPLPCSSRRYWAARRRMRICPISSRRFSNWG